MPFIAMIKALVLRKNFKNQTDFDYYCFCLMNTSHAVKTQLLYYHIAINILLSVNLAHL